MSHCIPNKHTTYYNAILKHHNYMSTHIVNHRCTTSSSQLHSSTFYAAMMSSDPITKHIRIPHREREDNTFVSLD